MNNNFEDFNNLSLSKTLKHLNVPNGFKVKKEKINDKLSLQNHFIINDKELDEKIFIKFYAHIDPNERNNKKFSKKNIKAKLRKSAKKR